MKPPMPTQTTPDQVENAFYEALQQGRLDALMACWTDEEDPVCVQPGGPRLIGLQAIASSFEALFEHGPIAVRPERVHQSVFGGVAVHSVLETVRLPADDGLREATVFATNVYVLSAAGWRLAVHHASPGQPRRTAHPPVPSQTLH